MIRCLLRVLGLLPPAETPSSHQRADEAIAEASAVVARVRRDRVADAFRDTEQAMKGRPRVP